MTQPVLRVKQLIKDYDAYRAVDGVSFEVKPGQVMGLLGPNGAGKSTTIQMLVGITEPTSGEIHYFGRNFAQHRQAALQRINFASAYNTLQGRITVEQNLQVFAGLYQVERPKLRIAELLEQFEIGRLAKHKYWDLSAGERTRVNLAKSLLNRPELVLLDEPTASLDPDIADKTLSLIEQLQRDMQLAILFTSHNMAEVERVCDEVIFLDKGRVVSQDTPQNHLDRMNGAELILRFAGAPKVLAKVLDAASVDYQFAENQVVRINTVPGQIAGLVAQVVAAGVRVEDVSVNKPTLEDVFLGIARGGAA